MKRDRDYILQLFLALGKFVKDAADLPEVPFGKKDWNLWTEGSDLELKVQISNTEWVLVEYHHRANYVSLVQEDRTLYGNPTRLPYARYDSEGKRGYLKFGKYAKDWERDFIYKVDRFLRKGLAPNSIRLILDLQEEE